MLPLATTPALPSTESQTASGTRYDRYDGSHEAQDVETGAVVHRCDTSG